MEGISPQIAFLWDKISDNPEWIRFVKDNPEAARAAAWRAFGITIPRDVDIQEEIAKAEKARASAEAKEERRLAKEAELQEATTGGGTAGYQPGSGLP
jgi:hypothetical protein